MSLVLPSEGAYREHIITRQDLLDFQDEWQFKQRIETYVPEQGLLISPGSLEYLLSRNLYVGAIHAALTNRYRHSFWLLVHCCEYLTQHVLSKDLFPLSVLSALACVGKFLDDTATKGDIKFMIKQARPALILREFYNDPFLLDVLKDIFHCALRWYTAKHDPARVRGAVCNLQNVVGSEYKRYVPPSYEIKKKQCVLLVDVLTRNLGEPTATVEFLVLAPGKNLVVLREGHRVLHVEKRHEGPQKSFEKAHSLALYYLDGEGERVEHEIQMHSDVGPTVRHRQRTSYLGSAVSQGVRWYIFMHPKGLK